MTTLAHFIRSTRPADLRQHFANLGVDTADVPEDASPLDMTALADTLARPQEDRLLIDIERICAMVDEVGQAALLALPEFTEAISAIQSAHVRAHWVFLQSSDAFRRAEEIRYADENQNAQRLWDGFTGPTGKDVPLDDDAIGALAERLRPILSRDRIQVESFTRQRQRAGGTEQEVVQLTIYSEDVPEDEFVFADGTLVNRPRKPVRETAIIYERESGTIEVIGRQRTTREEVAAIFAEVMLGKKLSGERLSQRRFDLLPLLDTHAFPTQPSDGIAKVKLTQLALSSNDDRLTQIFRVPFKDPATLYDVVQELYGDENPLDGNLYPWSARIEVEFGPGQDAKRGKKIAFTLTRPNKCSLRGKTARERQILSAYLPAWGLTED